MRDDKAGGWNVEADEVGGEDAIAHRAGIGRCLKAVEERRRR